jgi:calcium-dependent protein kinase
MLNRVTYTLHDSLGSGGYSTVYKCTDITGIRYACKVLPKDKNKRERIQQEVIAMQSLMHCSRVPRLVDAVEDETSYYLVQEWCKGGPLKAYMSHREMLYGENTVASITRGILRGLYQLHTNGVIHRDVKASNIMLADASEDAEVKIIDFGAAVMFDSDRDGDVVEVEEMVGTPWFMSPESLSHKCTPKTDIWGLGVLVHLLLSSKLPFNDASNPSSPSYAGLWRSIFEKEPTMSSEAWDMISSDAKDFVRLCLCKEHQGRPSALELLNHTWLTKTDCIDRFSGTPLQCKPFEAYETDCMFARTFKR